MWMIMMRGLMCCVHMVMLTVLSGMSVTVNQAILIVDVRVLVFV